MLTKVSDFAKKMNLLTENFSGIWSYLKLQRQLTRSALKKGFLKIAFCKIASFIPVDTGRLLNVLCTFSLRPVSTGFYGEEVADSYPYWKVMGS